MQNDIPMMLEREFGTPEGTPEIAIGFGYLPFRDDDASEKAGRAMFREVLHIQKAVPGDKQSLVIRPARDDDKQKFPGAFESFQRRATTPMEGTPLETVPWLTRSEVLNLKAYNIFTLEMLAQVSDANAAMIGFSVREQIAKAKQFIATAKNSAAAAKAEEENRALKDQLAEMQRQIDALSAKQKPRVAA